MNQRIAVIGAGTIGASWAAIFLARGNDVAVSDPSPQWRGLRPPFHRQCLADA